MMLDPITMLGIGAALLMTLTTAVLFLAAWTLLNRGDGVDSRLNTYLQPNAAAEVLPIDQPQLAQRLNDAINKQGFSEKVSLSLEQANLKLTVPEYVLMRIAVPLLFALAGLLSSHSSIGMLFALLLGVFVPGLWIRSRRKRRNQEFNDQLAETLSMLVSSLRGGFSLVQSLANTTKEAPEPTKSELRRVTQEIQLGVSLAQALDNLVLRIESEDLDLVVTSIKINARVGGNLTTILETIGTTIRERSKLRREVRVITSMQRISSYVIGLLPVGLAAIIFTINPTYMMRLFQPNIYLCIPIGAAISALLGFIVIQRIIDIKV